METISIVIVGAGLAGLTAAYRLQQRGHKPVLYEARSRPGGRVLTVLIDQSYEELGGKSLLDGGDGRRILNLIAELGLKTESYTLKYGHAYIENNIYFHPSDILKNVTLSGSNLSDLCHDYIQSTQNLGEIFDTLFSDNPTARSFMRMWARNFDGSDADQLAPEYIYFYLPLAYQFSRNADKHENKLEFVSVENGNSRLIEALAAQLDFIHYHSLLCSIKKSGDDAYLLHFGNDKIVKASYVILTMPCSTLRDVEIEPGIFPEDQMDAIQTLQYGTNRKILLSVKLNQPISELLWTDNTSIWFNKKNDVMTFYTGGQQGLLTVSQVGSFINHELHAVKKFYPQLHWQEGSTFNMRISDWAADKFSKGSYSNWGIRQYALFHQEMNDYGEPIKKVFRSINRRLFFAGEHTDLQNSATMEGAVLSGERAARMLEKAV
jgi:monoamine oxidase